MTELPEFLANTTVYVQKGNLCGIFALAHYCLIDPDTAYAIMCHANNKRNFNSGATTRHIHHGLKYLNYEAPQHCKLLPMGAKPPDRCIVCIRWIEPGTTRHGSGHWAVYDHGYIICSGPAMAGIFKFNDYISTRKGCYTAYLPIKNLNT